MCGNNTGLQACESHQSIRKHVKDCYRVDLVLIIALPLLGPLVLIHAIYKEILKATEELVMEMCTNHSYFFLDPVQKHHLLPEKAYFNSFLNEIRGLTNIEHRNIAKLHGFCSSSKHTFLVYEYLEQGSLAKIFSSDEQAKRLN